MSHDCKFTKTSNFKKIDVHAHALPKNIPDFEKQFGYGGFVRLEHRDDGTTHMIKNGQLFRVVQKNCFDTEERIKCMNEAGVNLQCVSTVPVMFSYWAKPSDTVIVSRFVNDDLIAECAKYPDRLIPLGTLPMNDVTAAVEELRRCVVLGVKGFEIGSHVGDKSLDHESFYPLYKTCQDLNVTLFVHPWDMHNWDGRLNDYWMPWLVGMPSETAQAVCSVLMGNVLTTFPHLKLCFAHGGGSYPIIRARVAHGYKVRPDICATKCADLPQELDQKLYFDSLVHDPNALELLLKCFGEDKIVLGTDYPFPLGELDIGKVVEEHPMDRDRKDQILWSNAVKMFDLDEKTLFSL